MDKQIVVLAVNSLGLFQEANETSIKNYKTFIPLVTCKHKHIPAYLPKEVNQIKP